jgi:AraC-like DNA-binding protein
MRIQLEAIKPDAESSFHIMVNPRLNDFFFWHFHPEIELTYIEGADGNRHVGDHISKYKGSDLVLIGSNIPHLNFDYGVKSDYQKIVLHIQPHFLADAFLNQPELKDVGQLFIKSTHGVAITGKTKARIGQALKQLHTLSHFDQFIEVLRILQIISQSNEIKLLHPQPVKNQYNKKEQARLQVLYQYIDSNHQQKITIRKAAALCHLSEAAFCRYFKKITQLTFTQFLNHYRINQAKRMILSDHNISEACYSCGFESLSYFQ